MDGGAGFVRINKNTLFIMSYKGQYCREPWSVHEEEELKLYYSLK